MVDVYEYVEVCDLPTDISLYSLAVCLRSHLWVLVLAFLFSLRPFFDVFLHRNDICYFYAMRSDEVSSQILGDLKKDAKLGNDASVAAIKPFCDSLSQAPLTSESKFPTEVFWLALKALRVLFK